MTHCFPPDCPWPLTASICLYDALKTFGRPGFRSQKTNRKSTSLSITLRWLVYERHILSLYLCCWVAVGYSDDEDRICLNSLEHLRGGEIPLSGVARPPKFIRWWKQYKDVKSVGTPSNEFELICINSLTVIKIILLKTMLLTQLAYNTSEENTKVV